MIFPYNIKSRILNHFNVIKKQIYIQTHYQTHHQIYHQTQKYKQSLQHIQSIQSIHLLHEFIALNNCKKHATLVVPLKYSKYLLRTSTLTISCVIFSYINNLYTISYLSALLLLTSINYWRYPVYGLRRNIDICTVFITILYHLYYFHKNDYYLCIVLNTLLLYPISLYYGYKKNYSLSVFCHSMLHICGNIINIIIYNTFEN